jgi:hypothetical protein
MAKKHHDQEVFSSHEGFREYTKKYGYFLEWKGTNVFSFKSDLNFDFQEGHFFNSEKGYFQIRRIQQKWIYGCLHTLVHLEKSEDGYKNNIQGQRIPG